MADLGRREEALAAIEEAAAIYRRLAEARPDAFLPDLAAALNNQSESPGRPGAAGGGPGRDRGSRGHLPLGSPRPTPTRSCPTSPRRWNNQSNRLADLGRREGALAASEEAAGHLPSARRRPTLTRSSPNLATSLNNQSGERLADLGRREEALAAIEEAVAIRRRLAGASPHVYFPDLAASYIASQIRCRRSIGMQKRRRFAKKRSQLFTCQPRHQQ